MDSMLLPFLMTSDESEADKLLADLLCRCAVPAVESIVRSMFGGPLARAMNNGARLIEDADDIVGEVNVKILDRLRRLKESQNEDNINDFMGYVAGTAYNVCNAYVRLKYLNWHNLRKRIRNTLTRHAEFALWDVDGLSVCGLSQWTAQHPPANDKWTNKARMNTDWYMKRGAANEIVELLGAAFTSAKAPILLEDLVNLAAEILQITDGPDGNELQLEYLKPSYLSGYRIDPLLKLEQRNCLKRLWTEIVHLPVRQRIALLLSVRDEGRASVTLIFVEISIASIREIAKAVGMSANEFAQILGTLPLDDKAISKRLGATCKQVMDYRVSARRRLLRRMEFIVRGKPGS